MFVAEIRFRLSPEADLDEIHLLLGSLRQNGQIMGKEWPFVQTGQTLKCYVLIPEVDSLDKSHDNKYVRQIRAGLRKSGFTRFQVKVLGKDPTSRDTDTCAVPNEYILITDFLTLESPLRCGACYDPVPLYRIPPTYDNSEYYNIKKWETDYQACDTLQMNCSTGERFGAREMSDVNSSLSVRGRKICAQIEEMTGKATYYYLHRYLRRPTRVKEEARRCPSCGGHWLLNERWHFFDFKCEPCRLVSVISGGTP